MRVDGRGITRRGGRPPKQPEEQPSIDGERPVPRIKLVYLRFTDRSLFHHWEPKGEPEKLSPP